MGSLNQKTGVNGEFVKRLSRRLHKNLDSGNAGESSAVGRRFSPRLHKDRPVIGIGASAKQTSVRRKFSPKSKEPPKRKEEIANHETEPDYQTPTTKVMVKDLNLQTRMSPRLHGDSGSEAEKEKCDGSNASLGIGPDVQVISLRQVERRLSPRLNGVGNGKAELSNDTSIQRKRSPSVQSEQDCEKESAFFETPMQRRSSPRLHCEKQNENKKTVEETPIQRRVSPRLHCEQRNENQKALLETPAIGKRALNDSHADKGFSGKRSKHEHVKGDNCKEDFECSYVNEITRASNVEAPHQLALALKFCANNAKKQGEVADVAGRSDHARVKETLRNCNTYYLQFVQEEEERSKKNENDKEKQEKSSKSEMSDLEEDPVLEEQLDERHVSSAKNLWRCPSWDPSQLFVHREFHISHRPLSGTRSYEVRTYGHISHFDRFFGLDVKSDEDLMDLWTNTGFETFSRCLETMVATEGPRQFVFGLLEWWWDTTNTFHFPWGEMTIMPVDFAMITGLSYTERVVEVDRTLTFGNADVQELLGPVAATLPPRDKFASPSSLTMGLWMPGTTPAQRVRLLLLLFISQYLVVDSGVATRCYIRYLPSLRVIEEVSTYDWAGMGYAHLLVSMRRACRVQKRTTIPSCQGLWRVIEFWAYEYLPKLAPRRPHLVTYPAMDSWVGRASRGDHLDVMYTTRRALHNMKRSDVNFRPWAEVHFPASVEHAMGLSRTRRIFWSVTDPVWYLGERVARQHTSDTLLVPVDPPPSMMGDDLKRALGAPGDRSSASVGSDWRGLVFLDRSYTEFRARLAPPVKYRTVQRDFASGDIPFVDLSVEYSGPSGTTRDKLAEPSEAAFVSANSLPPDFQGARASQYVPWPYPYYPVPVPMYYPVIGVTGSAGGSGTASFQFASGSGAFPSQFGAFPQFGVPGGGFGTTTQAGPSFTGIAPQLSPLGFSPFIGTGPVVHFGGITSGQTPST